MTKFVKIVFPESESRDFNLQYSRTTIQELESKYPELHLKKLAKAENNSVVEMKMDPGIIGQLKEWIFKKSKKGLANWVQWRYTMDRVSHIPHAPISRRTKMLLRPFYRNVEKQPKWRECVKYTRLKSPFLVDVLYYGQYLNETLINAAAEIFTMVKEQFIELVQKVRLINLLSIELRRIIWKRKKN